MRLRRALRSAGRSRSSILVAVVAAATVVAGGAWRWDGVPGWATAALAAGVLVLGAGTAALGWWPPSWSAGVAVAMAAAAHLLLAAWDDGLRWSEARVPGAVAIAALVALALVSWRWLNAGWFWSLAVVTLAAIGLSARDEAWAAGAVQVPAVAALGLVVLVGSARVFSKATLRLVTAATVVAGILALAAAGRSEAADEAVGDAREVLREAGPALDDLSTAVAALDDAPPALERRVRRLEARTRQVRLEVACGTAGEDGGSDEGSGGASGTDRCLDWPTRRSDAAELVASIHDAIVDTVREAAAPPADLQEARAERDEARRRADELDVPVERDVRRLVASGGDALVREAFEPVLGSGAAARLGDAGWLVLGVLAALGYRRLEVVNNRRYGAPVTADGDPSLTGEFAERVASMRLVEPSPVPGGAATTQLVGVLREGVGFAKGQEGLSKAFAAVWALVQPPAGVTANLQVHGASPPPPPPADDEDEDDLPLPIRVSVTLRTTAGARFVRSYTTALRGRSAAIEEAANFVAVDAVNYTRLCPPWQRWDDNEVEAFGLYRRVVDDTGRHPVLDPHDAIPLLERACRLSPATGVVRVALGHQYDAAGKPVHALREHLLARLEHERLAVARYRTATSLSMAASPADQSWWSGDAEVAAVRRDVVRALVESGALARVARTRAWRDRLTGERGTLGPAAAPWFLDPASVGPSRAVGRTILLLLAAHELRTLERRSAHPVLLWHARRQDEREVWLAHVRDTAGRRRAQARTAAAELIVRLRLALLARPLALDDPAAAPTPAPGALDAGVARVVGAAGLLDHADKPGAYYNLACFYAVLAGAMLAQPELGHPGSAVARALGAGAGGPAPAARTPFRRRRRPSVYGPADTPRELAVRRSVWLLDRAVRLIDAPVPSATWVDRDPDLAPIRHEPAYRERFTVPSGTHEQGGTSA